MYKMHFFAIICLPMLPVHLQTKAVASYQLQKHNLIPNQSKEKVEQKIKKASLFQRFFSFAINAALLTIGLAVFFPTFYMLFKAILTPNLSPSDYSERRHQIVAFLAFTLTILLLSVVSSFGLTNKAVGIEIVDISGAKASFIQRISYVFLTPFVLHFFLTFFLPFLSLLFFVQAPAHHHGMKTFHTIFGFVDLVLCSWLSHEIRNNGRTHNQLLTNTEVVKVQKHCL